MMQMQFCTFGHGFIGQPSLKEVLFENIPLLGQEFFCPIRENHADAFDVQGFDVVRQFKVQVLNSKVRQTLATMNRRAYFRVSLEKKCGKSGSGGMQGSRTTAWSGTDDHNVVHLLLLG